MNKLFAPERRKLVAKGLMTTFGLTSSGVLVGGLLWKTGLKVQSLIVILLVSVFIAAWLICPITKIKEEEE